MTAKRDRVNARRSMRHAAGAAFTGSGGAHGDTYDWPMDAPAAHAPLFAARAVTEIFAPPNLVVVVLLAVGWHGGGARGVAWALVAAAFCSLVPYTAVRRGIRRGRWTDRHLGLREQRVAPMLVAMASIIVGLGVLLGFPSAPRELLALQVAMLAGLGVSLVITRWWKVSIHTAVVSGVISVLMLTYGAAIIAAVPLVALTGWSRVALGDHTAAQTVAGALVGAVAATAVFGVLA